MDFESLLKKVVKAKNGLSLRKQLSEGNIKRISLGQKPQTCIPLSLNQLLSLYSPRSSPKIIKIDLKMQKQVGFILISKLLKTFIRIF